MSNEPTRAAFSSPAALVMARTARRVADAYNDKALRSAAADLETRSLQAIKEHQAELNPST